MGWKVTYKNEKKIFKEVAKFRPSTRKALFQALTDLEEQGPAPKGWKVEALKGHGDLYKMNIDYRHRMIYEVEGRKLKILIIKIGSRENFYDDF